jgi:hypothetical protein
MRIGIDARELCGRPTGVGRYLAGLLREWMAEDRGPRHEFVLYAPGALDIPLDARRLATRSIEGPGGTWWAGAAAARRRRGSPGCVFAPAYGPLRMTTPTVAAIHDLSRRAPRMVSDARGMNGGG